jgi:hypothetical protein
MRLTLFAGGVHIQGLCQMVHLVVWQRWAQLGQSAVRRLQRRSLSVGVITGVKRGMARESWQE